MIDCKMSPDNVASSITLGNFTVGRRYRPNQSDMPDSPPEFLPLTAMKLGLKVSHIISRKRYRPTNRLKPASH